MMLDDVPCRPPLRRTGDAHSAAMRRCLDALGARSFGWAIGINAGPTPRTLAGIERRLRSIYTQHGVSTSSALG